jgi:hypothetical protein
MKKAVIALMTMSFLFGVASSGVCKDISSQHSEWKNLKKTFAATCKGVKKCEPPSFKSDLGPSFDTLMKLVNEKDRKAVGKKANKVINDIQKAVKTYQAEIKVNENRNRKSLGEKSKEFASLKKLYERMNVILIYFEDYADSQRKLFK